MKLKQSLYEILGVDQRAERTELQAAFSAQMSALEQARNTMAPQAYSDKVQVLRVALNSLSDAGFRLTYDAKLAAARIPASAPEAALSLVPIAADDANAANASNEVRTDALSLRADALSLRADAMMLRTQGERPRAQPAAMARKVASSTMAGFQYLSRAVGLLVIVGGTAFGLTRCMNGDFSDYRARLEAKAAEKTALQEYFQTHGVRPANMAEEAEPPVRTGSGGSEFGSGARVLTPASAQGRAVRRQVAVFALG
ncbi:hypothetical protein [Rhodoferax sp. PAMC 29310]|uniref:hypothetical protein n=1 Tax=Rhodoferax sp. PAMC 29310 TaxID=2822760 RepID=UPI001B324E13|nr:hypothetical protein [Rhodoferax sp. PAMC 29310]